MHLENRPFLIPQHRPLPHVCSQAFITLEAACFLSPASTNVIFGFELDAWALTELMGLCLQFILLSLSSLLILETTAVWFYCLGQPQDLMKLFSEAAPLFRKLWLLCCLSLASRSHRGRDAHAFYKVSGFLLCQVCPHFCPCSAQVMHSDVHHIRMEVRKKLPLRFSWRVTLFLIQGDLISPTLILPQIL